MRSAEARAWAFPLAALLAALLPPQAMAAGRGGGTAAVGGPAVPDQPACGPDNVRWAGASNRLYISGDVRCTLGEVRQLAPAEAPLSLVDPGARVWLLGADLVVEGGATLLVDGSPSGDAAELRLRSDPGATGFVEVRAQWGQLVFHQTRVTSWDTQAQGPDTDPLDGRAFVRALSFEDGTTPRESRMDVRDSDIGFLGYDAAESYGLVWKVRGDSLPVLDRVDVYGEVTGSTLHDNYFGMYTFGAYGMHITGNTVVDNVGYGIDPHDDSDALVVEGNTIRGNGNHGFICSKRCDGLTIRDNVSSGNGGVGFMLHQAVTDSVVEGNLAEDNATGGFAIVDSLHNVVRGNVAHGNKYGIRLSVGASDNVIEDNDFSDNLAHAIYLYKGVAWSTLGDGRPRRNTFTRNQVLRSGQAAIRLTDADENVFVDNVYGGNQGGAVTFEGSDANVLDNADLGGGVLRAEGPSTNTVRSLAAAEVSLVGPDAALLFEDATGRVFTSGPGAATHVDETGAVLTLTGADAPRASVQAEALAVVPDTGDLWVEVSGWTDAERAWRVTPGSAQTARFTVNGLVPGARYTLYVDGLASVVVAEPAGALTLERGTTVGHTFRLVPAQ